MDHLPTRRQFVQGAGVVGLGLLAACGRLPGQSPAPAPKVSHIGFLQGGAAATDTGAGAGLLQGLRALGYVEGQNLLIEWRYTEGQAARLQEHTAELVALPLDV